MSRFVGVDGSALGLKSLRPAELTAHGAHGAAAGGRGKLREGGFGGEKGFGLERVGGRSGSSEVLPGASPQ